MIKNLTEFEDNKAYMSVIKEIWPKLVIIPSLNDYKNAEKEGKVLYYEYYEEYLNSMKNFFLLNYTRKPIELIMFREALGQPDLRWKKVQSYHLKVGACAFIGWSKERYFFEYPKAMNENPDYFKETKYGFVRLKCNNLIDFPKGEEHFVESWECKERPDGEDR